MEDKHALWKWLILIALVAFSLWVVTPPKEKIRLGLDLKGGTSLVVKIDEDRMRAEIAARDTTLTEKEIDAQVAKALEGSQARALEVIRNRVNSLGTKEPIIYPGKDNRIIVQLPGTDEEDRKEAETIIKSAAFLEFRMVHDRSDELVQRLFSESRTPEGYIATQIGTERVFKEDPGFEPERDLAYRERLSRFEIPNAAYEFMLQEEEREGQVVFFPHFVKRRSELTGESLKNAKIDYRALGQPVVALEFDLKGAKKFSQLTGDNAPGGPDNPNMDNYRRLAIVMDGTIYSAPVIREAIPSGRAEISGNFTVQDATFLSNVLKSGSLPAPVKIVERRFVAPSLGEDAIRSGVSAVAWGAAGVVAFMLLYYMLAGLVADLALVLNIVLLPLGMILAAGFLSIFAKDASAGGPIQLPVLTLPGIAGILLTIGMAVDANVLIFERIREECKVGKSLGVSIRAGYDRAFLTIVDANLTTLLTGVILFIFGSGPIRGFAVTLSAGIMASMFTALVVTKLFFGVMTDVLKLKTLRMLSIVKETSIDFIGKRKIAATISILLIVVSWGLMIGSGIKDPASVFSVDFTGGTSVTFAFDEKVAVETLRTSLIEAGVRGPYIQYQEDIQAGGGASLLQVKVGNEDISGQPVAEVVRATMMEKHPDAGFVPIQEDTVGAQIGKELKGRAVLSIILALLGIIIYISLRFEFGFALGAIVALAHDVMITVGIYCLCGRQLSLPIVAALLTIVGYSVNDTIVVFDRIREDLKLIRNKGFKELCNLSINQTLSRTLLTSLTTLITVVMLLVLGGGAINDFAFALFIGVLVGTYSSIFVATPVVLLWHRDKRPDFSAS